MQLFVKFFIISSELFDKSISYLLVFTVGAAQSYNSICANNRGIYVRGMHERYTPSGIRGSCSAFVCISSAFINKSFCLYASVILCTAILKYFSEISTPISNTFD